jgi:predicted CoA-binding protein
VTPRAAAVEGWTAYPTLADVPVERLDRVSLYLPAEVALQVLPGLKNKAIGQLWLNPGADSPEVVARARELGLAVVVGCSIVDVGVNPHTLD